LLSDNKILRERDLHFDLPAEMVPAQGQAANMQTLDELEKEYIERILSIEGGRVEAAAKRLGYREVRSTTAKAVWHHTP